jgi:hypothetical protein
MSLIKKHPGWFSAVPNISSESSTPVREAHPMVPILSHSLMWNVTGDSILAPTGRLEATAAATATYG